MMNRVVLGDEKSRHYLPQLPNTVAIIILLTNSAMFGYFPTNLSNRLRKPGLISSVSYFS